jgi:hypothetical protein
MGSGFHRLDKPWRFGLGKYGKRIRQLPPRREDTYFLVCGLGF